MLPRCFRSPALPCPVFLFFFFNATATTEIYTLSLHDALPICDAETVDTSDTTSAPDVAVSPSSDADRKSTRLNSSHTIISYAFFCLQKKKTARGRAGAGGEAGKGGSGLELALDV